MLPTNRRNHRSADFDTVRNGACPDANSTKALPPGTGSPHMSALLYHLSSNVSPFRSHCFLKLVHCQCNLTCFGVAPNARWTPTPPSFPPTVRLHGTASAPSHVSANPSGTLPRTLSASGIGALMIDHGCVVLHISGPHVSCGLRCACARVLALSSGSTFFQRCW